MTKFLFLLSAVVLFLPIETRGNVDKKPEQEIVAEVVEVVEVVEEKQGAVCQRPCSCDQPTNRKKMRPLLAAKKVLRFIGGVK
jgi:hypothetical protein